MNLRTSAQHIYHHYDDAPKVNIKVERNSRGYNWEVTVSGAKSPDEALAIIQETEAKLKATYGEKTDEQKA